MVFAMGVTTTKRRMEMDVITTTRPEPKVTDIFGDTPLEVRIQKLLGFIAEKTPLVWGKDLDAMKRYFAIATDLYERLRYLDCEVDELRSAVEGVEYRAD
jgi:hypothetical protein